MKETTIDRYRIVARPYYWAAGSRYYADVEDEDVVVGDVLLVEDAIDEDGDLFGIVERTGRCAHVSGSCLVLDEPPAPAEPADPAAVQYVPIQAVRDALIELGSTDTAADVIVALALYRTR